MSGDARAAVARLFMTLVYDLQDDRQFLDEQIAGPGRPLTGFFVHRLQIRHALAASLMLCGGHDA